MGYLEIHTGSFLIDKGHQVEIFTSESDCLDEIDIFGMNLSKSDRNHIHKLPLKFSFRSTIIPNSQLLISKIRNFAPELIVIFNIGSGFGNSIYKNKNMEGIPIISIFTDAYEYRKSNTILNMMKSTLQNIGFFLLGKKYWYRRALKKSDLILYDNIETKQILRSYNGNNSYASKLFFFPSPPNPNKFFYDEVMRFNKRKSLGISDDQKVILTVTKMFPNKGIEELIQLMIKLIKKDNSIIYFLVGSLKNKYSTKLKKLIKSQNLSQFIHIVDQQDQLELNSFYNAADIGIWYYASQSINEGMVTGLKVIIPDRPSVNLLIKSHQSGYAYNALDEIDSDTISELISIDREKVTKINSFLNFEDIMTNVFIKLSKSNIKMNLL